MILAALVMTPVYFCYEWTLAAIESKRDDGRVYEPDIKGAESIAEADGSVSVQQYDRSKAKEVRAASPRPCARRAARVAALMALLHLLSPCALRLPVDRRSRSSSR